MRSNSNENNSDEDNHFNEDDDNLIYLGSMNPENTLFSSHPETCYYMFLLNIKSEMRSFKSNENIHKKEGGSYYVVSANKASSVTL